MKAMTEATFLNEGTGIRRDQLLAALQEEQFQPYFQPIVQADGTWRGAEMLMRWQHPQRGLLAPALFLTRLAEEALLVAATRQILNKTRETWREAKLRLNQPFFLSFNACLEHVQSASLVSDCRRFLVRMGERHLTLMVEMPERGADLTVVHCEALFRELEKAGVKVAIDDFGIGDARLHQFACGDIESVKIDRSFVEQMGKNVVYERLIGKIVELAQAFGAQVTVEGVETAAQLERLGRLGVKQFQGYLFGRPMSSTEFFARLSTAKRCAQRQLQGSVIATPNLEYI